MQKRLQYTFTWISLLILLLGIVSPSALAATATTTTPTTGNQNSGQALEIAPPVIYLTVSPGETLNTSIYIRDIASGDLLVTGQANDFVAEGESGTPKILLNGNYSDPYSLKNWITLPSSLILIPHEIKTMAITINVPSNASPGGHFGVIRFTAVPPSLQNSGVALSASLGALLLVTVTGKITEHLSFAGTSINKDGKNGTFFQNGPLNFVQLLKNTGNEQLQPIGQVNIFDMFGKKLAGLNINLPPGNVLPDSTRQFSEALNSSVIGNKFLFGKYKADIVVNYGTPKQTITTSMTFWVIPYKLIAIVIVGLIILFFILRYALRRYNIYILKQARRPQQKKTPPRSRRK